MKPHSFHQMLLLLLIGMAYSHAASGQYSCSSTAPTVTNTFSVTTGADNGDDNNPTTGSLRYAVQQANIHTNGLTAITFNISGSKHIYLKAPLTITRPVTITGSTTNPVVLHADPSVSGFAGVMLEEGACHSEIKYLHLDGFQTGISLRGSATAQLSNIDLLENYFLDCDSGLVVSTCTDVFVIDNTFGTNTASEALGCNYGIVVRGHSSSLVSDNITIGGTSTEGNVIANSRDAGVFIRPYSQNVTVTYNTFPNAARQWVSAILYEERNVTKSRLSWKTGTSPSWSNTNGGMYWPLITSVIPGQGTAKVSGVAESGTIHLYLSNGFESMPSYLGTANVTSRGTWEIPSLTLTEYQSVLATLTSSGKTSEFSPAYDCSRSTFYTDAGSYLSVNSCYLSHALIDMSGCDGDKVQLTFSKPVLKSGLTADKFEIKGLPARYSISGISFTSPTSEAFTTSATLTLSEPLYSAPIASINYLGGSEDQCGNLTGASFKALSYEFARQYKVYINSTGDKCAPTLQLCTDAPRGENKTYYWYKNGKLIACTSNCLTTTIADPSKDAGEYTVKIYSPEEGCFQTLIPMVIYEKF